MRGSAAKRRGLSKKRLWPVSRRSHHGPWSIVYRPALAGFSRLTLYRARRACGAQIAGLGTGLRDPNKTWALAVSRDEASQAPGQVQ